MKKIISVLAIAAAMSQFSGSPVLAAEQSVSKNDSIATTLRLRALQERREVLQKEIKSEDSKRNRQIAGVSAETLEAMNNRQDSLCLALRSELVDVILEIKELTPSVSSAQLVTQYNNIVHRADSAAGAQGKPEK